MSATEAPSGTGPRTVVVNGTGTNSLSFQLPPGVTLDVESVYAAIDATAAGATTATLTIQEQSGVVIASKAQSQTVDTGVVGSATWALRLTDSQTAAPAASPAYGSGSKGSAGSFPAGGVTPVTFNDLGHSGVTFGGTFWQIDTTGVYQVMAQGIMQKAGAIAANSGMVFNLKRNTLTFVQLVSTVNYVAVPVGQTWQWSPVISCMFPFVAGDALGIFPEFLGAGSAALNQFSFSVERVD